MKNDITAVRNLLIEGMERILNPEKGDKFGVEEAHALAEMGKVLIESAKAEVAFVNVAQKAGAKVTPTNFLHHSKSLEISEGK